VGKSFGQVKALIFSTTQFGLKEHCFSKSSANFGLSAKLNFGIPKL